MLLLFQNIFLKIEKRGLADLKMYSTVYILSNFWLYKVYLARFFFYQMTGTKWYTGHDRQGYSFKMGQSRLKQNVS